MKTSILIALFLGTTFLFAETHSDSLLDKQMKDLRESIEMQKHEIIVLKKNSVKLETAIDSIRSAVMVNTSELNSNTKQLSAKILETGQQTEAQISQLDKDVEKSRLHWIIASLVILLLGTFMYLFLRKRITLNQSDIELQIKNTKKFLEEESFNLDGELLKLFQKQLEIFENNSKSTQIEDHSLVLKVADRLTAMETNHYRMDQNTRGLKQLKNAVKSIKENYLANGYEIVEMLEFEFKEGMNVTANFIPSDKIEKGKRIITRVIKPQVNYNGKMIQAAQVEVSVGE